MFILCFIRSLRDKLIQDERLDLAMNVSTKCGLDPSAVWSAWGKVKLRAGDYLGARDKFSKCLKVRRQSSHTTLEMRGDIRTVEPCSGETSSSPPLIKRVCENYHLA